MSGLALGPMNACRGLLIDLDGTLVATEELHIAIHAEVLGEQGLAFDGPALTASIGANDDLRVYRALAVRQGRQVDDAQLVTWIRRKDELTHRRFASSSIACRAGVRELLDTARAAGLPIGLVTSTRRRLTDIVLRQAGLAGQVSWSICYDDVSARKPDPMPYRLGLERLGLAAADCLVLEDSVPGVTAARAAGCTVVACRGTTPQQDLAAAGAAMLIDDLRELLPGKDPSWPTA